METENSIVIHAPLEKIFETAANVSRWPEILPHYRWVRYLVSSPEKNVIQMAARRKWIPVRWTSELEVDFQKKEVRFFHLKAFTKGMKVVWSFLPVHQGVEVRIRHNLKYNLPLIGKILDEVIIGKFFIGYIANQTLTHMKTYLEQNNGN